MLALQIEKKTKHSKAITTVFNNIIPTVSTQGFDSKPELTKLEILTDYFKYQLRELKVGRGGAHIWISGQDNERIAIITL